MARTQERRPSRIVASVVRIRVSTIAVGILLTVCPGAFALNPAWDVSQYAHTAWKVREGFLKGPVHAIAQTPDGYLWLGTEFGLLRFDGVRSITWQPPGDLHLPSTTIMSLMAARDGSLWIGTLKGLSVWKNKKLAVYEELAGQAIMTLLEDREGTVWVGAYGVPTGRLCAIQTARIECHGEDGILGDGVINLYEDSKGNVWSGVRAGLWKWKPGAPKFYSLPGEPDGIRGLGEDDDGTLLIGMGGGIRRFIDGRTEAYLLPPNTPHFHAEKFLRDRDGGLWIATTDHGLVHLHQGRADVFGATDGLTAEYARNIIEDREGNVWVATLGGLDRFRGFAVVTLSVSQGLSNAIVSSVLADRDGTVWLSTYGGLDRWEKGKITAYGQHGGKLNGLPPNSLFKDHSGRIWVSTPAEVGYLQNDRFVSIRAPLDGFVNGMSEDSAENLWIANQVHGLFRLLHGIVVQRIPWIELGDNGPATALVADPVQGGLWLGFSMGGVAHLAHGRLRSSYSIREGLGGGRVNGLRVDADGTLWAATEGGLSRLKDGRVATLSSKNGLPCDIVHAVLQDDDHASWLNMPCGLVRISGPELDAWCAAVDEHNDAHSTIQAAVFDSSEGARSHAIPFSYSPQAAKSSDGRLWFASLDGVSLLDPRDPIFNKLPPPVYIEQVIADNRTYDATADVNGSMHLPALIRDLEIDYTALSFVVPEKVRFRYKLEGRDHDWQDAGTRRQAFYSDLPPRKYRFRVAACNNNEVWNETGASLDFSIAPAYYQANWFRALCGAAFLAALWGFYQLRLRQMAREFNAGLEARVNERTRIARELHDSLLQGVQGLMFRLQAVRDMLPGRAPAEAIEALDIALARGDKAIAESRDTLSDLRETRMGDGDIAKALTALGEELAGQSGNGSVPCVRVLVEGKPRELNPMVRDEIYRIGREAVRNAYRHAKAQKIEAEITYRDSELLFHVRDDGIGIAPEVADRGARAGHWGLPGMRERAKSFGGKLEVWSEHGTGTEIELIVPAAVAYCKTNVRRRFWFLRRKTDGMGRKQSKFS